MPPQDFQWPLLCSMLSVAPVLFLFLLWHTNICFAKIHFWVIHVFVACCVQNMCTTHTITAPEYTCKDSQRTGVRTSQQLWDTWRGWNARDDSWTLYLLFPFQDWLSKFGYLPPPDPVTGQLQTKEALTKAIKAMQKFGGLKETGVFGMLPCVAVEIRGLCERVGGLDG